MSLSNSSFLSDTLSDTRRVISLSDFKWHSYNDLRSALERISTLWTRKGELSAARKREAWKTSTGVEKTFRFIRDIDIGLGHVPIGNVVHNLRCEMMDIDSDPVKSLTDEILRYSTEHRYSPNGNESLRVAESPGFQSGAQSGT